jgi:hypothetical protein
MVILEAANVLGLTSSKQVKKVTRGLEGVTALAKSTCAVPLVTRNGDLRVMTAREVENIATLPGGHPPEELGRAISGIEVPV